MKKSLGERPILWDKDIFMKFTIRSKIKYVANFIQIQ